MSHHDWVMVLGNGALIFMSVMTVMVIIDLLRLIFRRAPRDDFTVIDCGEEWVRFIEHTGGDRIPNTIRLRTWDELIIYCGALLCQWPSAPPVTNQTLHITQVLQRTETNPWTHIVYLDGYGVMGFTDGDFT
jgi:hypothetical protein